jgi:hypothetical protein
MEEMKQCPFCAESIKSQAIVCRYCHSSLAALSKERKGKFVRVKLKTRDKIYYGDIFVPSHLSRVSDVINDERHFVSLANTKEETKASEIHIGFLAISKSMVEWIRMLEKETEPEKSEQAPRSIFDV